MNKLCTRAYEVLSEYEVCNTDPTSPVLMVAERDARTRVFSSHRSAGYAKGTARAGGFRGSNV
jgi:hypothetical protein